MKARPILFSGPMVRALLDGMKVQTRRTKGLEEINEEPSRFAFDGMRIRDGNLYADFTDLLTNNPVHVKCPYGQPGDLLWCRETWQSLGCHEHLSPRDIPVGSDVQYPASYDGWVSKHRPSIHMPRWVSRITLGLTDVRMERLQEVSRGDAMAEGCPFPNLNGKAVGKTDPIAWFSDLWKDINGPESWDANHWVWPLSFNVHAENVDNLLKARGP